MICTSFRDFNLHIPHRRWPNECCCAVGILAFQSTPSSQKVTVKYKNHAQSLIFQSTPSSQKVTGGKSLPVEVSKISIHTFLTEGDRFPTSYRRAYIHFNPHLPHRRWQQFSTTTPPLPPPIINYIVQYSPTKSIAIFLLLPILSFSRCESPGIFMLTSDSHQLTTLLSAFYLRRNPFTISQPGNLPQALSQSPTHTSYDSLYSDNISDLFPYPVNFQLAWDQSTVSAGQKSYSLPRMLWYRQ